MLQSLYPVTADEIINSKKQWVQQSHPATRNARGNPGTNTQLQANTHIRVRMHTYLPTHKHIHAPAQPALLSPLFRIVYKAVKRIRKEPITGPLPNAFSMGHIKIES